MLYSSILGDASNQWNALSDVDTHVDIWLGCLTMGAMLNAPNLVGTGYSSAQYFNHKHKLSKADKSAEVLLGGKWNEIRDAIDGFSNEDIAENIVSLINDSNLSHDQIKATMDYAGALQAFRGHNLGAQSVVAGGDADSAEAQQLNDSFREGYSAHYERDLKKAQKDLAAIKGEMRRAFDFMSNDDFESLNEELDADPISVLERTQDSDLRQVLLDYANQKIRLDGMTQRVQDDVDDKLAVEFARIDNITNRKNNYIQPVTLKTGRKVYVVSGDLLRDYNGKIDIEDSDKTIIVRDAENGELKFVDVTNVSSVDEILYPHIEKERAEFDIRLPILQKMGLDDRQEYVINGDPDIDFSDDISHDMHESIQAINEAFGSEAEYYMAAIEENPWTLVDNPGLTIDQQEAVLYYINAKAALDGAMNASNEVADRERSEVRQSIERRTHKKKGLIVPATMKVDDRQVYVINGDVAMFPDGTAVDVRNSSESVVVMDAQTGEYEFTSPVQINGVSETIDPQDELDTALSVIEQEQNAVKDTNMDVVSTESGGNNALNDENESLYLQTEYDRNEISEPISQGIDGTEDGEIEPLSRLLEYLDSARASAVSSRIGTTNERAVDRSGTSASRQEVEARAAEAFAKESGNWIPIDDVFRLGIPGPSGNENDTYRSTDNEYVYKVNNLMNSGGEISRLLEKVRLHNEIFPETSYEYVGITGIDGRSVYPVIRQRYVDNTTNASLDEIADYMSKLGFEKTGEYEWSNGDYIVSDLRPRNVLKDADGDIYVIDAELSRKQTALSHIPVDESTQEPQFTAVDPETAWDGLVEYMEAESDAAEYADGMIAAVEKQVDAANKAIDKVKPAGSARSFKEEKAKKRMEYHLLQQQLDRWKKIVDVYDRRRREQSEREVAEMDRVRTKAEELYKKEIERQQRELEEQRALREEQRALENARKEAQVIEHDAWNKSEAGQAVNRARTAAQEYYDSILEQAILTSNSDENRINRDLRAQGSSQYAKVYSEWGAANSLDEWAARYLSLSSKNRIRWSGKEGLAHQLTGDDNAGERDGLRWITSDASGVSFAEYTHRMWETLIGENDTNFNNKNVDDHDLRNVVIDLLRRYPRSKDLYELSLSLNQKANAIDNPEIEIIRHNQSEIINDWYVENLGLSQVDYEAREEAQWRELESMEIDDDAISKIAEDIINDYIYENERTTQLRSVTVGSSTLSTESQILSGQQSDVIERGDIAETTEPKTSIGSGNVHFRAIQESASVKGLTNDGLNDLMTHPRNIIDGQTDISDPNVYIPPTPNQIAAGNYKMEHRRVDGYNISIVNAKGSVRRGTDADGKSWETTMQNDYGYIRGTEGVDGDHIDVFLSDTPENGDVFVIDQVSDDGSFDEHKVMYGFPSEDAAREAYLSNYEPGWTGLGTITHVSKEEFKKWIGSSKRKTKPFAEYKSVKPIFYDNQGNPIDENGNLIIENVKSVADIKDVDFNTPSRTIGLPTLPGIVQQVLSTNGKRVIIKKNIFERNALRHDELTPAMSRTILSEALYNPTLYGKNKPLSRPNIHYTNYNKTKSTFFISKYYSII